MNPFIYTSSPLRVIFGQGTLSQLSAELSRQSCKAPLILSSERQAPLLDHVHKILPSVAGVYTKAKMHTPIDVTMNALDYIKTLPEVDCVISIGGGSTIGLGKAISVRTGLYHFCLPTTYAGSEMTSHLGELTNGKKVHQSKPKILPGTVIYDVDLTLSLPVDISCVSGVNAIAHAVEALYAQDKNPITTIFALEGIKSLAYALPLIQTDPKSIEYRTKALYGAWLCGLCLQAATTALHHKICHTLAGSFNLPHAQTHTIVLPHAVAYNFPDIPEETRKALADALPKSDGDAIKGLNELVVTVGGDCYSGLKAFGMKEDDIEKGTTELLEKKYWNPRKVERPMIQEVIRRIWAGEKARADL